MGGRSGKGWSREPEGNRAPSPPVHQALARIKAVAADLALYMYPHPSGHACVTLQHSSIQLYGGSAHGYCVFSCWPLEWASERRWDKNRGGAGDVVVWDEEKPGE